MMSISSCFSWPTSAPNSSWDWVSNEKCHIFRKPKAQISGLACFLAKKGLSAGIPNPSLSISIFHADGDTLIRVQSLKLFSTGWQPNSKEANNGIERKALLALFIIDALSMLAYPGHSRGGLVGLDDQFEFLGGEGLVTGGGVVKMNSSLNP